MHWWQWPVFKKVPWTNRPAVITRWQRINHVVLFKFTDSRQSFSSPLALLSFHCTREHFFIFISHMNTHPWLGSLARNVFCRRHSQFVVFYFVDPHSLSLSTYFNTISLPKSNSVMQKKNAQEELRISLKSVDFNVWQWSENQVCFGNSLIFYSIYNVNLQFCKLFHFDVLLTLLFFISF